MNIFFIFFIIWIIFLCLFWFSSIINPKSRFMMDRITDYFCDNNDKLLKLYFSLFKKTQSYIIGRFFVPLISIFWLILGVFIVLIIFILFIVMIIVLFIVSVFYSIIGFKNYVVGGK